MKLNIKKQFVCGILMGSLLATSFGGAFASSALAADSSQTVAEDAVHNGNADKGILAGLAAVGLIAALTSRGGSSGDGSAPKSTTSSNTTTTTSASDEQQAVALLNQDRAKYGLASLKVNSQLTALARAYAQDMIKRGYFSHYNPEGQSPFDRMQQAGISYSTAGENLAVNTSVSGAETAFMNSSGHRANILSNSYTEVGIGVVRTSNGQVYVVQEFIGR